MIYEIWFQEKEFQLLLHRARTFVVNNGITDVRSFSVHPITDQDTNEIVYWESIMYYTKEKAVEHCLHTDAGKSADLQAVSNASAESTSQEGG